MRHLHPRFLYYALIAALLSGCQNPQTGESESERSGASMRADRQEAVLNRLRNEINLTYGFKDGVPRINLGPCGRFAKEFREQWNARFKRNVNIIFVMTPDGAHCYHVLVRLPDGNYYDGGNGVIPGPTLLKHYREGTRLDEMVEFDLKLLDKWSYGLGRSYENCPNYSDQTTRRIIEGHLSKLPKETD